MEKANNQSSRAAVRRTMRFKRKRRRRAVLLISFFIMIALGLSLNSLMLKDKNHNSQPRDGSNKAEDNSWQLILVNGDNPLPTDYQIKLAKVQGRHYTDERIASYAKDMISAAKADGIDLLICSSYRSAARQEELFDDEVNKHIAAGKSYDEALGQASFSVALPGKSEHSTGLALDIVTPEYQLLDNGFVETEAFKWLKKNAHEYGFILRYPEDKTEITNITYEPWHYRFVGKDNAREIKEKGVALEEFLDK